MLHDQIKIPIPFFKTLKTQKLFVKILQKTKTLIHFRSKFGLLKMSAILIDNQN